MPQTQYFRPRNWEKFQGYKKRGPKWIQLHVALLSDHDFKTGLTELQQWHCVQIWLLYARTGRELPLDSGWIAGQLGANSQGIGLTLKALLANNYIELVDKSVAKVSHQTETETYTETEKKETPSESPKKVARKLAVIVPILDFETWWQTMPRKVGKKKAEEKYAKIVRDGEATETDLLTGAQAYAAYCVSEQTETRFQCHPITWLNQGRWKDDLTTQRAMSRGQANDLIWERMKGAYENGDASGDSGNHHQSVERGIRAADRSNGGPKRLRHDS